MKTQEFAARLATLTKEQRATMAQTCPIVTIEQHPLSLRNNLLCMWQIATPTVVGGFRQWLVAGRCVRKGEKAAYIMHPCAGRKADDGTDGKMYFRETAVFDISQTEAIPSA